MISVEGTLPSPTESKTPAILTTEAPRPTIPVPQTTTPPQPTEQPPSK